MTNFVCAELETTKNIYGGYDCAIWVDAPAPFIPDISQQQVNQLGGAIIFCLMFAWGWKQLQSAF